MNQNGMNLLAEFDAYGNTIAEYTHGHAEIDGVGSMVAAKKTDWTDPMNPVTYYQYPIYNGPTCDVMALVDENGNVVGDYEYDPWGNRLHAAETGAQNRFGYRANWITLPDSNGEIIITPTRPYHAPTGRFLQRDPLCQFLLRAPSRSIEDSGRRPLPHEDESSTLTTIQPWEAERRQAAPLLAEATNRYDYVLSNPGLLVDPRGHRQTTTTTVPPDLSDEWPTISPPPRPKKCRGKDKPKKDTCTTIGSKPIPTSGADKFNGPFYTGGGKPDVPEENIPVTAFINLAAGVYWAVVHEALQSARKKAKGNAQMYCTRHCRSGKCPEKGDECHGIIYEIKYETGVANPVRSSMRPHYPAPEWEPLTTREFTLTVGVRATCICVCQTPKSWWPW